MYLQYASAETAVRYHYLYTKFYSSEVTIAVSIVGSDSIACDQRHCNSVDKSIRQSETKAPSLNLDEG